MLLVFALASPAAGQDFVTRLDGGGGGGGSCSSLIQHIDMEDVATDWEDQTGNGNHMTAGGTPTFDTTSPAHGSASLELDGSTDYLVMTEATASADYPFDNAISGDAAFTYCTKVRLETTGSSVTLLQFDSGSGFDTGLDVNFSDQLICYAYDVSNSEEEAVIGTTSMADGTWYSACCAYSGGATGTLRLFVDGTEEGTAANYGSSGVDRCDTGGDCTSIGRTIGGSSYTDADLDEVVVYNAEGDSTFASSYDSSGAAACP